MKRFLVLVVAALALAGCAVLSAPVGTDVQKGAYTAKVGFQGALNAAVLYIELPRCDKPTSPTVCSKQAVVDVLRKSLVAADNATQAAEDAARSLSADSTVVDALTKAAQASVSALIALLPRRT